jgi:hypothetical protein
MINAADVIVQIQKLLEDPDGQFYDVDDNIVPALNGATEWIVSVVTPSLYSGKYSEQAFREISHVAVFQSSGFGRVSIDPEDVGNIWAITSVFPKPSTIILASPQLQQLQYYTQIRKYIGKTYTNAPIITKIIDPDIPLPEPGGGINTMMSGGRLIVRVPIPPQLSLYRPEMAFVACQNTCEFQSGNRVRESWNQHRAGSSENKRLFNRYSYTAPSGYSSLGIGGYQISYPPEIEVFPSLGSAIVGIGIIKAPTLLTEAYADEIIMLPDALRGALINKTISIISAGEGDTTTYQTSEREVLQLIGAQL